MGIQPKSSSEYNRTPRSSRDPGGRRTQIEQIFYSNRNGGTGNSLGHGRGPRRNQRSREPGSSIAFALSLFSSREEYAY